MRCKLARSFSNPWRTRCRCLLLTQSGRRAPSAEAVGRRDRTADHLSSKGNSDTPANAMINCAQIGISLAQWLHILVLDSHNLP